MLDELRIQYHLEWTLSYCGKDLNFQALQDPQNQDGDPRSCYAIDLGHGGLASWKILQVDCPIC